MDKSIFILFGGITAIFLSIVLCVVIYISTQHNRLDAVKKVIDRYRYYNYVPVYSGKCKFGDKLCPGTKCKI